MKILGTTGSQARKMRLTIEQRIAVLERENVVLNDTVNLLHKMLKEHRELIHDFIRQKVVAAHQSKGQNGDIRPEDALYAFKCRQRFDRLGKELDLLRRLVEKDNSRPGLRAG